MPRLPYLPLWVGDFMADTQHLDCRESGALLLLLFAAWTSPSGGLPDEERQLARLARCSLKQWRAIREAVLAFWHRDEDGQWHQKRLDEERRVASDKTAAARLSAHARWLKNKESGRATAVPTHSVGNARQNHTHTQVIDSEDAAPNARAGEGARAAGLRYPLRLTGADSLWKLRLLSHRPGASWNAEWGAAPESDDSNHRLDREQRRQWRTYWGLDPKWREGWI